MVQAIRLSTVDGRPYGEGCGRKQPGAADAREKAPITTRRDHVVQGWTRRWLNLCRCAPTSLLPGKVYEERTLIPSFTSLQLHKDTN